MRKRIAQALTICAMTCVMFTTNNRVISEQIPTVEEAPVIEPLELPTIAKYDVPYVSMPAKAEEVTIEIKGEIPPEEEPLMSQEDINLLAIVTMAEAEGESEMGKRLVIDTILNRIDSEQFPDTVSGVVYQKKCF